MAKQLELLHELLSRAARVAVFVNPANVPNMEATERDAQPATRARQAAMRSAKVAIAGLRVAPARLKSAPTSARHHVLQEDELFASRLMIPCNKLICVVTADCPRAKVEMKYAHCAFSEKEFVRLVGTLGESSRISDEDWR